jgi:hypothetical protein
MFLVAGTIFGMGCFFKCNAFPLRSLRLCVQFTTELHGVSSQSCTEFFSRRYTGVIFPITLLLMLN